TAPPIENPSRSVRGASSDSIAARASSTHRSRRRHDLTRYFTSPNVSCGSSGASRRTSHSSVALHVPSTSRLCPPVTHTTAADAGVGDLDPDTFSVGEGTYVHAAARGSELECVRNEVVYHLPDPGRVGRDGSELLRVSFEHDPARRRDRHTGLDAVLDQGGEV